MTMIVNLLLHRLKDHLTTEMIDNVAVDDVTRAGIVKIGRFQDNPVDKTVYISISGGDQQDPEMVDGILDSRPSGTSSAWQTGFTAFSREIGGNMEVQDVGSTLWWRRGRVQVGCFFITQQLTEEAAAEAAYEVLGRLTYAIEHCRVNNLVDSYNERAVAIFAFASNYFESGGPPKQYIWRGSVKFQVLTSRTT